MKYSKRICPYYSLSVLLMMMMMMIHYKIIIVQSIIINKNKYFRSLLVYEMRWERSKIVPNVNSNDNNNNNENVSLTNIFPPRAEFASVTYKGSIYIIAGANDKQFYNDIWSMNFYNRNKFNLITNGGKKAKNIFSPRYSHRSILFNDEIYVMGGFTNEPVGQLLCDVWKMQDNGQSWKRLTVNAWGKKGRIEFGAISYNKQMFVMGGKYKSTIYDIYIYRKYD